MSEIPKLSDSVAKYGRAARKTTRMVQKAIRATQGFMQAVEAAKWQMWQAYWSKTAQLDEPDDLEDEAARAR